MVRLVYLCMITFAVTFVAAISATRPTTGGNSLYYADVNAVKATVPRRCDRMWKPHTHNTFTHS